MIKKWNRRQFLRAGLVLGAGVAFSRGTMQRVQAQDATPEATGEGATSMGLPLTGQLRQVHDPVMIKDGDTYYVYHTGNGIGARKSADMLEWEIAFPPSVFTRVPAWALEKIPGATNMWAPDISYFNDKFHLYYSVSTFGSDRSVIGLVTNEALEFGADGYSWQDQGLVVETLGGQGYNAIDPNLILDEDGVPWLAFGSYWGGIKMIRLDYETGKPSAEDETLYSLAARAEHPRAIEAPFIIRKGDFYYLFVSFDACCSGVDSTYRVMVGRSETVTGPYVDRDGVAMMDGGGTQVTFPTARWRGPGHNGIYQEDGEDYIVYHAYDAHRGMGTPTLHIDRLVWDDEGWPLPVIPTPEEVTES